MKKILSIIVFTTLSVVFGYSQNTDSVSTVATISVDSATYSKAFEKLSPEQIVDVLKRMEETKERVANSPFNSNTSMITNIAPFLFVILIVLMVQIFKYQNTRTKRMLAMKYIEMGKELPDNFFEEKKKDKSPLRSGIIFLSIGLGMFIMFYIFLDPKMSAIAAIPFCLGLGFLVIHYINQKNQQNDVKNS